MPKLTQSQLDLLHDVLMQYCEDCDTSTETTLNRVEAFGFSIL